MVKIVFDIILSLLAVIGIIGLCVEFSRIRTHRRVLGSMETKIYFTENVGKTEVIREILEDRRFTHKIKVPAESLEVCDLPELERFIESGEIELI